MEEQASMETTTLWQGRFLSIQKRGRWEFAVRNTGKPAVAIVAVTDENQLVLVEQFRPPVNASVIELPAGLAGDIPGQEEEPLLEAAKRELLEETGFVSDQWTQVADGLSSAGLTNESTVVFYARDIKQVAKGGGVGNENIVAHLVPVDGLLAWLNSNGKLYDLKLLGAVYAAIQS